MTEEYKAYGQAVVDNARTLAATLMSLGLPLVSGGTDNHLMLVDVTSVGLGGKRAEAVLEQCGITVNMNMIPFDTRKPMDPSGIRIGTPALTTRGMGADEMKRIGGWIHQALAGADDESSLRSIRGEVSQLCEHFPVPAGRVAAVEPA
jgi:glycine hydroxymethyltransferase